MDPKEQFIADLYPAARQVSRETGMAWQTILAQAAQETGWGQHQLAGTHNIFNIKADHGWHGPTKTFNVWEIEHGRKVWLDQSFRVYGSYEEALRDRVKFLESNPRYAKAGLFDKDVKGDLAREAAALQKAGYATDPGYAESLVRVFNSPLMQRAIRSAELHQDGNGLRTPSVAPHAAHVPALLLREGNRGDAVRSLQRELHGLGYSGRSGDALRIDGDFGAETRRTVETFQRDHHLRVDGIVGAETRAALQKALAEGQARSQDMNSESTLLTDSSHPEHALFRSARSAVRDMEQREGIKTSEKESEHLAAALTVASRRAGIRRIDRVVLGVGGGRAFVFEESLHTAVKVAEVDVRAALHTSMAHHSENAAAAHRAWQAQQPGAPSWQPEQVQPQSVQHHGLGR